MDANQFARFDPQVIEMMQDDTELFKLFTDHDSFKRSMRDTIFSHTCQEAE